MSTMPLVNNSDLKSADIKALAIEIASSKTDPSFYGGLDVLPNPDTILRKAGKQEDVFDAIAADAHVIGDLRSARAGLLSYEWSLTPGGDDNQASDALALCDQWMRGSGIVWSDVFWSMLSAVYRGMVPHELIWEISEGTALPQKIVDRPGKRFVFDEERNLRILTRQHTVNGEEIAPGKIINIRHMPTWKNPYGIALFSSCFWPYTFKHAGFKFFAKFCENYGFPWPVGKYSPGTPDKDIDLLADALAKLSQDNVGVIPNDSSVEFLEVKSSGKLIHNSLIEVCNREMSKALTSQTLASDQSDQGARAAAETHLKREQSVISSDRHLIEQSINQILQFITLYNFGDGVASPTFSFYQEEEAPLDWLELIKESRNFLPISEEWAANKLRVKLADKGDQLPSSASSFTAPKITPQLTAETDKIFAAKVANINKNLVEFVAAGKSITDFNGWLSTQYNIEDKDLAETLSLALTYQNLKGREDAQR